MVVFIKDEERAKLRQGWHIVRGSQPYVERMLWGVFESFGERQYVFIIERDGQEQLFRDYERGVIFESEREAWEAMAQEISDTIAAQRNEILSIQNNIKEMEEELNALRAEHLTGGQP